MGALLQELLGELGSIKEGCGDGHFLPWGPGWETWERVPMPGAYVSKNILGWVSLHIGAPLWEFGSGVHLTGSKNELKEDSGYEASLSVGVQLQEPGAGLLRKGTCTL